MRGCHVFPCSHTAAATLESPRSEGGRSGDGGAHWEVVTGGAPHFSPPPTNQNPKPADHGGEEGRRSRPPPRSAFWPCLSLGNKARYAWVRWPMGQSGTGPEGWLAGLTKSAPHDTSCGSCFEGGCGEVTLSAKVCKRHTFPARACRYYPQCTGRGCAERLAYQVTVSIHSYGAGMNGPLVQLSFI